MYDVRKQLQKEKYQKNARNLHHVETENFPSLITSIYFVHCAVTSVYFVDCVDRRRKIFRLYVEIHHSPIKKMINKLIGKLSNPNISAISGIDAAFLYADRKSVV